MDPRFDRNPDYRRELAEAEARQEAVRDYAMLGLRVNICGVECLQFTPKHYAILLAADSPFVCGGRVTTLADVAQFLWVISPDFSESAVDRAAFIELVSLIDEDEATDAIDRYIDDAFMDSPPSRAGGRKTAATSFLASLVHELAKTYSWPREVILNEPLAAIYQYLRRMAIDDNPKAPMHGRYTDRVKKKFQQKIKKANG